MTEHETDRHVATADEESRSAPDLDLPAGHEAVWFVHDATGYIETGYIVDTYDSTYYTVRVTEPEHPEAPARVERTSGWMPCDTEPDA